MGRGHWLQMVHMPTPDEVIALQQALGEALKRNESDLQNSKSFRQPIMARGLGERTCNDGRADAIRDIRPAKSS
jgi:hypothetical protein